MTPDQLAEAMHVGTYGDGPDRAVRVEPKPLWRDDALTLVQAVIT